VERHIVVILRWSEANRLPYGHADLINNYYCKPEGEELFLLGPLEPAVQVDPDAFLGSVTDDEARPIVEAAVRRVPVMDGARLHGGWASVYDVSPDWQPVIGEIADGIFVDAGTSGHGFKLAPALGQLVGALVMGHQPRLDLSQFHPDRFKAARSIDAGYGAARILG
jgi:sarcosine oxidase subunit beta